MVLKILKLKICFGSTVSETYQKLLYDMWIQVDAVVTKEAFRTFYQHSRLIHYCLTPLLFLPW